MRRFFRIIYYIGGILLFVLIAIIGYTQTRSFKTYLRDIVLSESRAAINGQLQLGAFEGNLVTGFIINGVTVSDRAGDILSAERIELKYSLFGFLFKRLTVSDAVIVKPRINLFRSINGSWNVASLIKASPEDTTPSVWTINLKRVELKYAEVIFTDSLLLYERETGKREALPDSVIDYARIHLYDLSLIASAQIQDGKYAAKIRNFQFVSHTPEFTLSQFDGDFLVAKNEVSARNVHIVTLSSNLSLDVALKGVDITHLSGIEELKVKPLSLSLKADEIDTRELKRFLYPSIDFLDRKLKLRLKADGLFGDLNIDQLVIQMPHSLVQLQGRLRNLHHPRDLEMAILGSNNFVDPIDLLDCLPGLELPDLTCLSPISFSLTYQGRPLDFKARFIGSTGAGDIDVDGKMKIDTENTTYSGTIEVHSLALGTILKDEKLTSNLNAKTTIDGSGFDPRTITGLAKVEIDSSSINGLPMQHSVIVFDIADGMLRSHVAAFIGSGSYEVSGYMNFIKKDSMSYSINGKIRSFDLADLLRDKNYESTLSFDLNAAGAIGALARTDTTELYFYQSIFNSQIFQSAKAKAIFNVKDDTHSILHITSTAGDLDIDGRFTPASFVTEWDNSYRLVTEAVAYRFRSLDSLRSYDSSGSAAQEFKPSGKSIADNVDAKFRLLVKDFRPFGAVLHMPLTGHGLIEGDVVGDSMDVQFSGKASFRQFGLRSGADTLAADTASLEYFLGGISRQTMFETFDASIETELRNFEVNALLFNHVSGQILAAPDSSDFKFSAFIDSTVQVDCTGRSRMRGRLMEFELPELKVGVDQYTAANNDTVRLILGSDGFRIRSLAMAHDAEEATLAGYFNLSGISDLNVSLKSFLLPDLKQILHRGSYAKSSTQFDGIVNANALFRGSLDHPNIILDVHADSVLTGNSLQKKQKKLGSLDSHISYFEHVLALSVKLMSRPGDINASPDLLLSGSLPYDLTLAREAPHKLNGEVDLTLKTTGMNLEFLDPFIPEISIRTGIMVCDMRMRGPIEAPRYEGSMSIQNTTLLFNPLGIEYTLNGDLVPAGDHIKLERFTIQNVPQEHAQAGKINVSGYFTLLGLALNWFDLRAQGDLRVMSEEQRIPGQKLYGNLFAATGPNGLQWQGDLSASMVRGEVFVKEAQLVLPPEREEELVQASTVNVIFKDDTSRFISPHSETLAANKGETNSTQSVRRHRSDTLSSSQLSGQAHNSFLDGISYDISIEMQGPTQLHFVFNTQTSEELYADLQGRLSYNRTKGISRLTGQIDVSDRSYYNFIKRFDATGKLLFTGNVLNPELDIKATYQGMHVKDTTNQSKTLGSSSELEKDHEVLVTLHITGTRNEPKTNISLQTRIPPAKDWTKWAEGDDEANAISFIIAGQYRYELTDQQRTGLIGANLGSSLGSAIASGMLTGPVSETIRKNFWQGFQSVDVLYYGGQFGQSADLRVAGQVGEAVIRAGGHVFTGDFGNTNVSVELPMSYVLKVNGLHNLIFTFERRVEGIQNTDEQRRASNGARLFYRFTF